MPATLRLEKPFEVSSTMPAEVCAPQALYLQYEFYVVLELRAMECNKKLQLRESVRVPPISLFTLFRPHFFVNGDCSAFGKLHRASRYLVAVFL